MGHETKPARYRLKRNMKRLVVKESKKANNGDASILRGRGNRAQGSTNTKPDFKEVDTRDEAW